MNHEANQQMEIKYINTITIESKRECRTKFDDPLEIIKEHLEENYDSNEHTSSHVNYKDLDCDESTDNYDANRERIRLANERWNRLSYEKEEKASHDRNVKFPEQVRETESPIAYRKSWQQLLHKQHKKEGRLEKFKEIKNNLQFKYERITIGEPQIRHNDSKREMTRNDTLIPIKRMRTEQILEDLDETMREDQEKSVREPTTPIITVKFNNCSANALIDTGADISAITKELYDELNENNDVLDIIPVRRFVLRGAFSEKGAVIANKTRIKFTYDEINFEHEFFIVERMSEKVILGIDFIKKFKMTMTYNEHTRIKFGTERDNKFKTINAITLDDAERQLNKIIMANQLVFSEGIGKVNHYKHEIKVKHEEPFKKKMYPIPEKHLRKVTRYIEELEEKGIVMKQQTQFINPLVVVIKKNGKIRLCLDARELNKRMIDDYAQPPTIEEVFRRMGSNNYYSSIDIADAF